MSISAHELPAPTVANLQTLAELDASLDAKGTHNPGEGLYPRDGTDSVASVEALVADVTVPDQRLVTVWASGMAAVRESVNFAAVYMSYHIRGSGRGPVVAYSQDLYSQSGVFFENERKKGVDIIRFDAGDNAELDRVINDRQADVVFAETVANTPGMPVLDVEYLLSGLRKLGRPPVLILDNTLPLSTGIDFSRLLLPSDRVIVVESGTKNLMNNSELLGITYSSNTELMDALRKHKAHSGSLNSLGGLAIIASKLRATIPGFHARNEAVASSTGLIARALEEARFELGDAADFDTAFPASISHPNAELAQTMTITRGEFFPSPVVFITARQWSERAAAGLADRIASHPAMREQIEAGQIHFGQSFGLPAARLLYDRGAPNVRFAGGFDLADEAALASAINEAAADK